MHSHRAPACAPSASAAARRRAASQQTARAAAALCALLPFAFMLAAPVCDALARAL